MLILYLEVSERTDEEEDEPVPDYEEACQTTSLPDSAYQSGNVIFDEQNAKNESKQSAKWKKKSSKRNRSVFCIRNHVPASVFLHRLHQDNMSV